MIKEPLVSVLMTAFNREKYIAQAIESVLVSTYKNFELIIVDDCSSDRTAEIATEYELVDSRVKIYKNVDNLGDYPNRNKAASYAKGKYLKYVDADDCIYPWGLELLINMMEQFPNAGWGLCSLLQYVEKPFPFSLGPKESYAYNYNGRGLFHKAPLSAIIKRDVFENEGGFKSIRMAGDFEMWNRLAQKYEVVLMPDGVVWSRVHNSQEMNSYRKYILVYEEICYKYITDNDCPLSKSEVRKFITKKKKGEFKSFFINLIKFRLQNAFDNLKIWKFYLNK
jgi:glycosyltransferase involved in cell wall biosynthesis